MNIDKVLQDWIMENDKLTGYALFGWLNAHNGAVAIVPIPNEIDTVFIGGSIQSVTYDFMVQAMFDVSTTTDDLNTENMLTLREWQDWITEQEMAENYPDFGDGYSCYGLENLSGMPTMAGVDEDSGMAVFQFPARLTYIKEM